MASSYNNKIVTKTVYTFLFGCVWMHCIICSVITLLLYLNWKILYSVFWSHFPLPIIPRHPSYTMPSLPFSLKSSTLFKKYYHYSAYVDCAFSLSLSLSLSVSLSLWHVMCCWGSTDVRVHVWKSEDVFQELILSFHYVGSGGQI